MAYHMRKSLGTIHREARRKRTWPKKGPSLASKLAAARQKAAGR